MYLNHVRISLYVRRHLLQCVFQIFCMQEYKSHIALELQKPSIDHRKLQTLSMVSFAFSRNTFTDLDTPCWVSVLNLSALDVLGNEKGQCACVCVTGCACGVISVFRQLYCRDLVCVRFCFYIGGLTVLCISNSFTVLAVC